MPKNSSKEAKYPHRVTVRLTEEELNQLTDEANRLGISRNELVRRAVRIMMHDYFERKKRKNSGQK